MSGQKFIKNAKNGQNATFLVIFKHCGRGAKTAFYQNQPYQRVAVWEEWECDGFSLYFQFSHSFFTFLYNSNGVVTSKRNQCINHILFSFQIVDFLKLHFFFFVPFKLCDLKRSWVCRSVLQGEKNGLFVLPRGRHFRIFLQGQFRLILYLICGFLKKHSADIYILFILSLFMYVFYCKQSRYIHTFPPADSRKIIW